jgi:predicted anti-sigma-YlaC factor YlaD
MMSCKQTTEDATNYLEGPNSLRRRISHYYHLLMCYRCRRFYRQMRMVIALGPEILPPETPSDEQVEDVLQALKAAGKGQPSP